jgi:HAD superfamily hydrolase (TIGR01509 family)
MTQRAPRGAVVFDCDGVLLDTESAWTRAETTLFARHGQTFGLEHKRAMIGTSFAESARLLETMLDRPGRGSELLRELEGLAAQEFVKGVSPLPGAVELLVLVRKTRPVGVASNTHRSLLEVALSTASLDGAFPVVVAGDDVDRPKPAPDLYLRACELLGVRPEEAVALEDTITGVTAARAAGMYVIGIPSLPDTELEADLVVPSLADPAVREALGV